MRIVGVMLVRNEDFYVRQAALNVLEFCDELLAVDNMSDDATGEILRDLEKETGGRLKYHRAGHPGSSHDLIAPYAGTDTWIFGVDGDEIYDPAGLALLKTRLHRGDFTRVWRMKGNVLHVTSLDGATARGYAAPPSRSITKLYNFAAIRAWDGNTVERLHGGHIVFAPGWDDGMKRNLQEEMSWDASPLRCLHLCFLPRSSGDADAQARANIMETYGAGWRGGLRKWTGSGRWKREYYRKGESITVDATPFFPS